MNHYTRLEGGRKEGIRARTGHFRMDERIEAPCKLQGISIPNPQQAAGNALTPEFSRSHREQQPEKAK